ncbi:F-box/RNI-like superfamily protein, partial [Tanacetum coccineum]
MIPNPGEVMKHSSANNDDTFIEEDLISKLPDALLTQILSLLSDVDACRTSILLKRWKDLWMFLPNLHVVIPICEVQANEYYYDLVHKTLAILDADKPENNTLTGSVPGQDVASR